MSDDGPKEKDQERGPAGKKHIMNRSKIKGMSVFPGGSDGKESARQCRRHRRQGGSIPGWGRSPRKENDNPLQYSCLLNSPDRRTWQVTAHGVAESDTTKQLTHTRHSKGKGLHSANTSNASWLKDRDRNTAGR